MVVALSNASVAVATRTPWPVQPEIVVGDLRYGHDLCPREYYLARPDLDSEPAAVVMIEEPTRDNLRLLTAEIVVHPDHRRRGHGTQIAAKVLCRAEATGRSTIWLWAPSDDSATAASRQRLGFGAGSQDARRRQN